MFIHPSPVWGAVDAAALSARWLGSAQSRSPPTHSATPGSRLPHPASGNPAEAVQALCWPGRLARGSGAGGNGPLPLSTPNIFPLALWTTALDAVRGAEPAGRVATYSPRILFSFGEGLDAAACIVSDILCAVRAAERV